MPRFSKNAFPFEVIIITGGSSGIGKAFIETICKIGKSRLICNLSRTPPEPISGPVEVQHFPCDLSDAEAVDRTVKEVLSVLDGGEFGGPVLLINNSGFGSYGVFPEPDLAHQLSMLDVNIRGLVQLTGRLLDLLRARGGTILNVASTAAFQPTPYMATYGASKAFVLHWSLGLREDLKDSGVSVTALCPGPTESQFFKRAGFKEAPVSGMGQTAQEVVDACLAAMGRDRSFVVTGWSNMLLTAVGSRLPRAWQGPIARIVLKRMRLDRMK